MLVAYAAADFAQAIHGFALSGQKGLHGFGIFFAGLSDGLAQKIRTGSEIFFDCGHGGLSGDATCKTDGFAAAGELARQTFDKAAAGVLVAQLGDAGDEVNE